MKKRTREQEKELLDMALDMFMNDCRARLHEMVDRGKDGWYKSECYNVIVNDLFDDTVLVTRGNNYKFCDISNRAMFLWFQKWRKNLFSETAENGER